MSDIFTTAFDAPPIQGVWSAKWDYREAKTNEPDVQSMWIADMDFEAPPCVKQAITARAALGVYGYTAVDPAYHDAIKPSCKMSQKGCAWCVNYPKKSRRNGAFLSKQGAHG